MARQYSELLDRAQNPGAIVQAAIVQRHHFAERLALKAVDVHQARAALDAFAEGAASPDLRDGASRPQRDKLVFVYSGQGTHWPAMALDLMVHPAFRGTLNQCDAFARELAAVSLLEELNRPQETSRLNRADLAQLCIFAVQAALTDTLRHMGLVPDLVIGQSLGELAAAYAAGALSLADAMRVVHARGRLMLPLQGKGSTAQINLPMSEVEDMLSLYRSQVSVAGATGPSVTIVAGETAAVEAMVADMTDREVFARVLSSVDLAFHSPQMDPLMEPLRAALRDIAPQKATVPLYSTVECGLVEGKILAADYWAKNLRNPFRLHESPSRHHDPAHMYVGGNQPSERPEPSPQ
jgi:acyl transferase domain-containing protein